MVLTKTLSYITPQGQEAARRYQYRGSDRSYLYKFIGSPLSEYLVQNWTPDWIAPNTITLIALLLCVAAWALTAQCSPYCAEICPWWVYTYCALSLFAYYILDNMDGKQARRTGNSSPLGLLFDHGCDAVNASMFGPVTCISAMAMGAGYELGMAWTLPVVAFFIATWEEFHTGDMILPVLNGPNEGLFLTMVTYLGSAVLGPKVWHAHVPDMLMTPFLRSWSRYFFGVTTPRMTEVMIALVSAAAIVTVLYQFINVSMFERKRGRSALRALLRAWPLLSVLFACWGGYFFTPVLFSRHPRIFLGNISVAFVDASSKLMISHVCAQKYRPSKFSQFLALFLPAHAIVRQMFNVRLWDSQTDETMLCIVAATNLLVLFTFIYCSVRTLADSLGIKVFRVKPKTS
eukprot:gb/GECG01012890.1/.p1 GENE.gb/GECG01012890.1/~~gb/GECG01012890.1/.p1  ORF type:complete len:403 (+),score=5.23 gb/GECG01012890.1/:1-1209(+)